MWIENVVSRVAYKLNIAELDIYRNTFFNIVKMPFCSHQSVIITLYTFNYIHAYCRSSRFALRLLRFDYIFPFFLCVINIFIIYEN